MNTQSRACVTLTQLATADQPARFSLYPQSITTTTTNNNDSTNHITKQRPARMRECHPFLTAPLAERQGCQQG
jgi:hypothetical protein